MSIAHASMPFRVLFKIGRIKKFDGVFWWFCRKKTARTHRKDIVWTTNHIQTFRLCGHQISRPLNYIKSRFAITFRKETWQFTLVLSIAHELDEKRRIQWVSLNIFGNVSIELISNQLSRQFEIHFFSPQFWNSENQRTRRYNNHWNNYWRR